MLIALKNISQLNRSTSQYVLAWLLFAVASLLPLGIGLMMLLVARQRMAGILTVAHGWIERYSRTIVAVILAGLGAALLRDGI